jgi:hypothetical protein
LKKKKTLLLYKFTLRATEGYLVKAIESVGTPAAIDIAVLN